MAYKIETSFTGGRVKVGAFEALIRKKRKASKKEMNRLGNILFRRVMKNITKPPIPLDELRRRGHPYAKRHSRIQTSKLGGLKSYQIMTRSSGLADSLEYSVVDSRFGSTQTLYIYFRRDAPDHVKWVVKGTRFTKMHPRDVINETLAKTNKAETIKFLRDQLEASDVILNQKEIRKIVRIGR